MQVISFMNMKGGVGKTTLAVNIAYALAYVHKKKILLVDADPQFNATQYLLDDDAYLKHLADPKKGTILDILVPKKPGQVNTTTGAAKATNRGKMALDACTRTIFDGGQSRGKLDLLPSTLALIDAEFAQRGTERKLKAYLQEKAAHYDYVLIDCPPTVSLFTQSAILASDKYLVPIRPDPLSVIGLPLLERWLGEYTEDEGMDLDCVGLVFTLVRGPKPAKMRDIMQDLRRRRKAQVFASELGQSTDVSSSVEQHQPVFQYKRNAKTAKQVLAIADEFLKRTGG